MTTIPLPWSKPPVTLNQRGGPQVRARLMASTKEQARWAIRAATRTTWTKPVTLTLHWRPDVRRRRDVDNPMPTLKACADALVAEGVLHDDDSESVPSMAVRIHPVSDGLVAAMWLELEEVA